jgi:hypothetical protein
MRCRFRHPIHHHREQAAAGLAQCNRIVAARPIDEHHDGGNLDQEKKSGHISPHGLPYSNLYPQTLARGTLAEPDVSCPALGIPHRRRACHTSAALTARAQIAGL